MSAWHLDEDLTARYAGGDLNPTLAASVEAHLLACHPCRTLLAPRVPGERLDRVWAEIADVVDAPVPGPVERLLGAAGVPEHVGRLLAAAASLRLPWIAASAVALLFAALASAETTRWGLLVFLTLAPIVPVAGVAIAYGRDGDPAHEIGLAAPYSMFRLMLMRAAAVVAVSSALALAAGLLLPGGAWTSAAWLLPALALTSLTLALSSRFDPRLCGAAVAAAWLVVIAMTNLRGPNLALFDSAGQLGYLAVVAGSVIVIVVRRREFS
ncbi:zf-HC2 domain-containing protein [Nonomuraea sp. NN258]|uniref:zf-HC2 domain-containing protein n=1 Tax=Nonomuraea antri TaxID=2730852 RepID=UPI001568A425|nr:zf-HC2 domain-containing protein [Nonomuraea antri]NRQ31184.1 zf-HC2 domain-containing protein [Nonomuraea antri]